MGAAVSTNSVDVVNKAIVDVIVQTSNNCSAVVNATQKVKFSGFNFFSSAEQDLKISMACVQNVKVDNDLLTQMANKIQQDASSQAIALLPGFSGSMNTNNLKNYLSTKINTSTIQQCAAAVTAEQDIEFTDVNIGSKARQTIDAFMQCMQTMLNQNQVAQGIVNDVTQKAQSKVENPLDFLGKYWIYIVIAVILIIGVIVIGMVLRGGGGGAGFGDINIGVPLAMPEYEEPLIIPYEQPDELTEQIPPELPPREPLSEAITPEQISEESREAEISNEPPALSPRE